MAAFNVTKITSIYCHVDDLIKVYKEHRNHNLIPGREGKRNREHNLSLSEMLTIMIGFHLSGYRTFKHYYLYCIKHQYKNCFPEAMSYDRFIAVMPELLMPLIVIMNLMRGEKTGIYFVDSTKMPVCHNKRTKSHKVFDGLANMGMSSYGWFMGFKLHLVINHKGEIMAVKITKASIDDRAPLKEGWLGYLKGKLFGDKGYIGLEVFQKLYKGGLKIVTGFKKNMKNILMDLADKTTLGKRSIIETVFDIFKNKMNLQHTRHRSPMNFLVNTISCLVAYCLREKKPRISEEADIKEMIESKILIGMS